MKERAITVLYWVGMLGSVLFLAFCIYGTVEGWPYYSFARFMEYVGVGYLFAPLPFAIGWAVRFIVLGTKGISP
ncbi:hypothetical protein [Jannaschia sp. 2305UL9-9]|uniref:hypothetical protein n=1 Tax=Jannaschia sp. 2305UL9-9 TaxID=3121638 RepID=UPI0035296D36